MIFRFLLETGYPTIHSLNMFFFAGKVYVWASIVQQTLDLVGSGIFSARSI